MVAQNPQNKERFLREARAAAAIEHPHIVAIFQVGEDNGVPVLAMPVLQGESLEDLKEHLADLHRDLTSGEIPCVRRRAVLEVA